MPFYVIGLSNRGFDSFRGPGTKSHGYQGATVVLYLEFYQEFSLLFKDNYTNY